MRSYVSDEDDCVVPSEAEEYAKCPHGPMLLFQRRKDGRAYYACAASRDRKSCAFFSFRDKIPSVETLKVWRVEIVEASLPPSAEDAARYKRTKALPARERAYCAAPSCSRFVFQDELSAHENHAIVRGLSDKRLKRPTEILPPLEDPKFHAQFFFDEKSLDFIVEVATNLETNVVCLGAPKIHEALRGKRRSFLLDLDHRFQSFYTNESFARFNMFNRHFFSPEAEAAFKAFLSVSESPPLIVVDPPFGGRVQPLSSTLLAISAWWLAAVKKNGNTDDPKTESGYLLPVLWAFPYFLEKSLLKERPEFQMLDFKVGYVNHSLFRSNKDEKTPRGSPIRFFTNLKPSSIKHPETEYRWCTSGCERWVAKENNHCDQCGFCPSKDGTAYVHCDVCAKCVKPSRVHCASCGRCELSGHVCSDIGDEAAQNRCFGCGLTGHKRRQCPENWRGQKSKGKRKRETKPNNKIKRVKVF